MKAIVLLHCDFPAAHAGEDACLGCGCCDKCNPNACPGHDGICPSGAVAHSEVPQHA